MKASKLKATEKQVGGGSYYRVELQPFEFALLNELSMVEGDAIKYIVRARKKDGAQDITKAIDCLEKIAEWRSEYAQLSNPRMLLQMANFVNQFCLGIHETRALWAFFGAILGGSGNISSLPVAIRELKLAKHSYHKPSSKVSK